MAERKVEISVDYDVKELLRSGKGTQTWDQYLIALKKQADEMIKSSKRVRV